MLSFVICSCCAHVTLHSFPPRRSSDLSAKLRWTASSEIDAFVRYEIIRTDDQSLVGKRFATGDNTLAREHVIQLDDLEAGTEYRSEEHTSELQSRENLICRLLLGKKNA